MTDEELQEMIDEADRDGPAWNGVAVRHLCRVRLTWERPAWQGGIAANLPASRWASTLCALPHAFGGLSAGQTARRSARQERCSNSARTLYASQRRCVSDAWLTADLCIATTTGVSGPTPATAGAGCT